LVLARGNGRKTSCSGSCLANSLEANRFVGDRRDVGVAGEHIGFMLKDRRQDLTLADLRVGLY
jgi:hypothetical protein